MAWPLRFIVLALRVDVVVCGVGAGAGAVRAPGANQQRLSAEQLDQMMAPVALYSDPLLAQVLMASTYPLEVVQADRWAKSHRNLKGDALTSALANESWDDSVKSLVQVPTVLGMMSDKLDWTQKVGDAVLAQQAGRDGFDPASAQPRQGQRQARIEQPADRQRPDREPEGLRRHRAGIAERDLRAVLSAGGGLWRVGPIRPIRRSISRRRPATSPPARWRPEWHSAPASLRAMRSGATATGPATTSMSCPTAR